MSKKENTKELIDELYRIGDLYSRSRSICNSIDTFDARYDAEKKEVYKDVVYTLKEFESDRLEKHSAKWPSIARDCLISPPAPPSKPEIKNPSRDILLATISGLGSLITTLVFLFSMTFYGNPLTDLLLGIVPILWLACLGVWFFKGASTVTVLLNWQKEMKAWKKEYLTWEETFDQSATKEEKDRFLSEFKAYDDWFLEHVSVCSEKYNKVNKRCDTNLEKIRKKYENELEQLEKELPEVTKQLDEITLIHESLIPHAWKIASMLSAGRADTLKEAINLVLEEEQRREEARLQQELLEQQAMENRRHNEAMERAAEEEARATRAHNEAMERAVQAQLREAQRQTELAKKQAQEAEKAAYDRCRKCANFTKCSYQAKKNSSGCGAYRPR